jgi:hypothetical protein
MIAYGIEHGQYSQDCDPAKPIPADVDDQLVRKCEHGLEEETKGLTAFTEADKKDARYKALLPIHAKFAAHVAKVVAVRDENDKKTATAERDVDTFRKEANQNSEGLWFLKKLEEGAFVSGVEAGTKAAVATRAFADRCKSTYAALKPRVASDEFLKSPQQACAVTSRMDATLRQKLPAVFARLRKKPIERSAELRKAIEDGEPVFAGHIPCAADPRKCGDEETVIANTAKLAGITVAPAPPPPPETAAAFQAAMKKATSTRHVGSLHEPAREAVMKAALKSAKIAPLVLALRQESDWVKKNDYDRPVEKTREGNFLVKVGSEPFCRSYPISVTATYTGAGTYGPFIASDVAIDDNNVKFVVSACN